jgi:hypothetical protein
MILNCSVPSVALFYSTSADINQGDIEKFYYNQFPVMRKAKMVNGLNQ